MLRGPGNAVVFGTGILVMVESISRLFNIVNSIRGDITA